MVAVEISVWTITGIIIAAITVAGTVNAFILSMILAQIRKVEKTLDKKQDKAHCITVRELCNIDEIEHKLNTHQHNGTQVIFPASED